MPTILLKKSDTPGSVPGTANLTNLAGGVEVAVNTADKRMFSMTSASAVIELGTNPSSLTCADASFTVARVGSLTISSLSLTNATFASATITNLTSTSATISSALTLSGGTANGVLYLNGSKVATSGSALTFDGTNLGLGVLNTNALLTVAGDKTQIRVERGSAIGFVYNTGTSATDPLRIQSNAGPVDIYTASGQPITFSASASEQMRLTSTGLGIGTSSPAFKLHVTGTQRIEKSGAGYEAAMLSFSTLSETGAIYRMGMASGGAFIIGRSDTATTNLTLDVSGNLGIGTSSPGAKLTIAQSSNAITQGLLLVNAAGTQNGGWYHGGSALIGRENGFDTIALAAGNVGIGTSSPGEKLNVIGGGATTSTVNFTGGSANDNATIASDYSLVFQVDANNTVGGRVFNWRYGGNGYEGGTSLMTLNASGNLGLGVTPSAWSGGGTARAIQIGNYSSLFSNAAGNTSSALTHNAYFDGTNWRYLATSVGATRYEMTGANAGSTHSWSVSAGGTAGNAISFTQAMTLGADGNLALGRTSAAELGNSIRTVDMNGGSGAGFRLRVNDTSTGYFYATASSMYLTAATNIPIVFETNSTERARITAGGFFKASNDGTYYGPTGSYHEFISTSSGENILRLDNEGSPSPYGIEINFSGASPDNNTQWFLRCADSTTTRCYIWSDGDLANHDGVYGTISDERLKQDIVDAPSQWDDLKAVRFRKYRMKSDVAADPNAPSMLGVVAQELEAVCPGLVDEHTDTDGETTKTVKSSILLMKAAVALQEAMARIEKLEAEVAALKGA